jgi:hypothetical protein
MAKKRKTAVGAKIEKIMKEGVRRNTKKPVSSKNPRRPVGQRQAIAIAEHMVGGKKKKR